MDELVQGDGPFSTLGEEVYDDYWMFYLTRDMAKAVDVARPYTNLKTYIDYKKRGIETLREHEEEITQRGENDVGDANNDIQSDSEDA